MINLSIVIPVYNEQETLPVFSKSLNVELEKIKKKLSGKDMSSEIEVFFVNDGSTDDSISILESLSKENKAYRLVSLSRNFGHQAAVSAGISRARGKAVVVMDADLQDPPELIAGMIEKWQEGYQVVYAIRRKRQAPLMLNMAYKLYYMFNSIVSDYPVHRDSGDFCLLDRKVVDVINKLPEKDRYMRGLRTWVGFKQVGVEYDRQSRKSGRSKYSFVSLVKLAFQGVLATSVKPLFLSGVFCAVALMVIFGMIIFVLVSKMALPESVMPAGWASLMITILFFSGAQLLSVWLLSLYVSRIYQETISRPTYVVEDDTLKPEKEEGDV